MKVHCVTSLYSNVHLQNSDVSTGQKGLPLPEVAIFNVRFIRGDHIIPKAFEVNLKRLRRETVQSSGKLKGTVPKHQPTKAVVQILNDSVLGYVASCFLPSCVQLFFKHFCIALK